MKIFVCILMLIVAVSAKSAPSKRQYINPLSIARPLTPSGYPMSRWGQWGPYGSCSATCGVGTRTRSRVCYSALSNTQLPKPTRPGPDSSLLLLLTSLQGNNTNSGGLSSLLPLLLSSGGSSGGSKIDTSMLLLLNSLSGNSSSSSGGLGNLGSLLPLLLGGGTGGMSNNLLLFTLLPQLTGSSSGSSNIMSSLLPLLLSSGGGAGAGGLNSILPLLLLSGNNTGGNGGMDLTTLLLLQMLQKPKSPVLPVVPPMPIAPTCVGNKYETSTCNAPACVVPTVPQQPQYTRWGEWGECHMQDNNKCVKIRTRTCLSSVCEATKQITYCQSYECRPVAPVSTCNPAGTRTECGYPGISQQDCVSRGCCFDSSQTNNVWCYQRSTNSYMRLKSGIQNSEEKEDPKPTPESNEEQKSE